MKRFNPKGYYRVNFDGHISVNLVKFCQQAFGDNDPHQAYSDRRWITCGTSVYLKDPKDVFWLQLKVKEMCHVEAQ